MRIETTTTITAAAGSTTSTNDLASLLENNRAERVTMLTNTRTQATTFAALVVAAVLCELVAHATYHKHGLTGAVSWVAFAGFWTAAVGAVATLVLLAVTARRSTKARA